MAEASTQADVIRLLSDPATHGGVPVERIDTHASVVFLAGSRVLKLKRAVLYDYLDYSTVDLRRRFCEAELRINRRMARELYRRLLPVSRQADGSLALGGDGVPVDWVIEMERFDQDALFDRLATAGRLDLALMAPLAEEIASFHQTCDPHTDFGGTGGIARVLEGNAETLRAFGGGLVDSGTCASLTGSARAALQHCTPLLERRRSGGMVRRCHGDLHLGNIVLLDGRPTLFDAIEFNDDISCIDVMYDVAFLLMDLWHRDLAWHANILFNGYLGATRDFDVLAALPLFLSCRAAIRAKTSATAARLQREPIARRDMEARAREYLDRAWQFLGPSVPAIVAVGGLSGTGKSTLARALAPFIGQAPGAVVLRSDEIRKRLCGVGPLTRLDASAYTPELSACVYDTLAGDAAAIVAAGHSVIVDAVFASADDRERVERAARATGARFAGLWLDAPEPVLLERVSTRSADPSDADAAVIRMQCARWSGQAPWCRVDASGDHTQVQNQARLCLRAQTVACDRVTMAAAS